LDRDTEVFLIEFEIFDLEAVGQVYVAVGDQVFLGQLVGVGTHFVIGHFFLCFRLGGAAGAKEESEKSEER
jgi:hypothetical protein